MKILIVLLTLGFLSACNKDENGWNSLTEDERRNLRDRATALCQTDPADGFREFMDASTDQYNRLKRFQNWVYEYKKPDGATTTNIQVWKIDSQAVYLLITEKINELSYFKFLKIEDDTNREMIQELKIRKCDNKQLSYQKGTGSGTLTKVHDPERENDKETVQVTDTYNFKFNELAFFINYHLNKKIEKFDNEDKPIPDSIRNYTSTLTAKPDAKPTHPDYRSYAPSKTQFCIIESVEIDGVKSYPFPQYEMDCPPIGSPGAFDSTELCYTSLQFCAFPDPT